MRQNKQWFLSFLRQLNKQKSQISTLFDELIFGKSGFCTLQNNEIVPITLYIYESVPQILVAVDNQHREQLFDLRSMSLQPHSYKHEMTDQRLGKLSYALLSSERQEFVIVFPHAQQRCLFMDFFKFYQRQLRKIPPNIDALLLSTFTAVDENHSLTISPDELGKLLEVMKLGNDEHLKAIIKYVKEDDSQNNQISYRQFEKVMKLMECRPELRSLFESYTAIKVKNFSIYTKPCLTLDNFMKFLEHEQGEDNKTCKKIAKIIFKDREMISFHEFSQFIFGEHSRITDNEMEKADVDMGHPLTSYFCLSSHNTYLTGNQLTSDSRVQRYLQDLEAGYRCVQIDVHNGAPNPIVKHGYTITSSISFEDVVKAIARFSNSNQLHTPIILSIENHANLTQQKTMAAYLRTHLGAKILKIEDYIDTKHSYPTLKECLGKIIIKNSGTFEYYKTVNHIEVRQSFYECSDSGESEQQFLQMVHQSFHKIVTYSPRLLESFKKFNLINSQLQERKTAFMKKLPYVNKTLKNNFTIRKKEQKVAAEMISLTAMLGNGSLERPCIWESISLSEGRILKHYQSGMPLLKDRTDNYWVRGYPSGSRLDSSNYNPLPSIDQGVQIIALNSQKADHYSLLMRQFFRKGTNNCKGYRLKPNNPASITTIKIRPISGFMFNNNDGSDQIPQVSVHMSFLGSFNDMNQNKKYTEMLPYTEVIRNNAYNPVFENPKTLVLTIERREYAFLLIEVPECGIAVLPLESIKKGYRTVNLFSDNFNPKGSFILFKVDTTY